MEEDSLGYVFLSLYFLYIKVRFKIENLCKVLYFVKEKITYSYLKNLSQCGEVFGLFSRVKADHLKVCKFVEEHSHKKCQT